MIVVAGGNTVSAMAAATGRILDQTTVNNAQFWGPPSISDGTIYLGDMNDHLWALSPSGF